MSLLPSDLAPDFTLASMLDGKVENPTLRGLLGNPPPGPEGPSGAPGGPFRAPGGPSWATGGSSWAPGIAGIAGIAGIGLP